MRFLLQQHTLTKLWEQRNLAVLLCGILLLVVMLLSTVIYRMVGQTRIVIVPPVVHKSFWIDGQHVAPAYLAEMANFFTSLYLTVSPATLNQQRETILRYTDPVAYATLSEQLVAFGARYSAAHLSSVFYPVDTRVDAPHLQVHVVGDLHRLNGQAVLPVMRKRYRLQFAYHDGRLFLQRFQEEQAS